MKQVTITNYEDFTDEMFQELIDGTAFGKISLPVPVANINEWLDRNPAVYELVLGISDKEIEKILYYGSAVITDKGNSEFEEDEIVSRERIDIAKADGQEFTYVFGMDAINVLLDHTDLRGDYEDARKTERECMAKLEEYREKEEHTIEEEETYDRASEKLARARALLDAIVYISKHRSRLKIKEIRLFPLELRSLLQKASRTNAYGIYHDLKAMYGRVLVRCERINRLMQLDAPEIIMINEKRMLQESVDALIANGKRGKPVSKSENDMRCTRTSLTDIILWQADII